MNQVCTGSNRSANDAPCGSISYYDSTCGVCKQTVRARIVENPLGNYFALDVHAYRVGDDETVRAQVREAAARYAADNNLPALLLALGAIGEWEKP